MTRIDISILTFKVISIYAFIKAIDKMTDIMYYILQYENMHEHSAFLNLIIISLPILLLAICGILLWSLAPVLSNFIFKTQQEENKTDISLTSIQMVAFSTIGLFVLASSLPDFVNVILVIITSKSVEGGETSMIHMVIVLILKISLGLWLFFGTRSIVNFIHTQHHYRPK